MILTDEEIGTIFDNHDTSWRTFARAIEAAVLEKLQKQEPEVYMEWDYHNCTWFLAYDFHPDAEQRPLYSHPLPPDTKVSRKVNN